MERDLFEEAPIPYAYLKLSVPVVLAMVLNVVYNMVDTWFISLTGDPNLVAGVSICAPIFILSIAMGDIWGLGGSSLISSCYPLSRAYLSCLAVYLLQALPRIQDKLVKLMQSKLLPE